MRSKGDRAARRYPTWYPPVRTVLNVRICLSGGLESLHRPDDRVLLFLVVALELCLQFVEAVRHECKVARKMAERRLAALGRINQSFAYIAGVPPVGKVVQQVTQDLLTNVPRPPRYLDSIGEGVNLLRLGARLRFVRLVAGCGDC